MAYIVLAATAFVSACGNGATAANQVVDVKTTGSATPDAAAVVAAGNAHAPVPMPVPTAAKDATLLAECPSTIRAGYLPGAGARLFGKVAAVGLPLTDGSIASVAPADYDPAAANLSESEADDLEGDDAVTGASFSYAPDAAPVSLVCRYGSKVQPLGGEAMLLIPLKAAWARCTFAAAKGPGHGSMTCHPMKPVD